MSTHSDEQFVFVLKLGTLVEASGRVQMAIGSTIRWGLSQRDALQNESNREFLLRELDDLKVAIAQVERALVPVVAPLNVASAPSGSPEAEPKATEPAARYGR